MHLVFNHVAELKHVDHTHCSRLVKTVACAAVEKIGLAIARHSGFVCPFIQVVEARAIENRCGKFLAEFTSYQPRTVSNICPRFIREGTPRGFRTISTGVALQGKAYPPGEPLSTRYPCCRGGLPSCRRHQSYASWQYTLLPSA